MKKLLLLCSILSIVLSVSLLFSCDKGIFCCEEQHSTSAQCSTCSPHAETIYDTKSLITNFTLVPSLIGEIFFSPINITSVNVIVTFDRPPATLS